MLRTYTRRTAPRPPRTATTQPRRAYATDLTDAQWEILRAVLPPAPGGGRPRTTNMSEVVNAILYVLRTGCAWHLLPHDFPPPGTVYGYFRQWTFFTTWVTPTGRGSPSSSLPSLLPTRKRAPLRA